MKFHPIAVEQAKVFKKSKSVLVEVLGNLDRTKEYLEHGVNSLYAYCLKVLGLSEYDTCQITQVIRKSQEVPKLQEAVKSGVISVEKASRIASVITPQTQELWINKAKASTHREIEREIRRVKPEALLREKITPKTAEKSELRINISHELEEKLRRAQEVFKTKNFEETLEKVLDLALKQKDPILKAKRVLQPRTCKVKPQAFDTESRYIPASIRHLVFQRDQGKCREKGCDSKHWVEIHHIIPISQGGKHELSNLITLCSIHHSLRHNFHKHLYKNSSPKINLNKGFKQQTDIRNC